MFIYYCKDCTKFCVRGLQGFIFGLTSQAMTDTLSEVEKRCCGGTFGGGLGTKTDPNEAVYLAPVSVSFCVEAHGETQARVLSSFEILIPRSCGLFETGVQQIFLVD